MATKSFRITEPPKSARLTKSQAHHLVNSLKQNAVRAKTAQKLQKQHTITSGPGKQTSTALLKKLHQSWQELKTTAPASKRKR